MKIIDDLGNEILKLAPLLTTVVSSAIFDNIIAVGLFIMISERMIIKIITCYILKISFDTLDFWNFLNH